MTQVHYREAVGNQYPRPICGSRRWLELTDDPAAVTCWRCVQVFRSDLPKLYAPWFEAWKRAEVEPPC